MSEDGGVDEAQLSALKAAVFGREAAALPPAERAVLEQKLARALADRTAAPGHSGRTEPAYARPGETAPARAGESEPEQGAGAELGHGAEPAPELLAGLEPEQEPNQPPIRGRRLLSRPVLLTAGAALLAITIGTGAVQFAEQGRDSLAVFEAAPTEADAEAPRWFGMDGEAEFRWLGELEGHRLYGALRQSQAELFRAFFPRAEAAPGTEPSDAVFLRPSDGAQLTFEATLQEVCLVAMHPSGAAAAGACVPLEEFGQQGIVLDVPGSPRLMRFTWGPHGPVRLEEGPAREL